MQNRTTHLAKKIALFFTFVCSSLTTIAQTTPDPGNSGAFAVSTSTYNLGDLAFTDSSFPNKMEVIGSVHYPTSLNTGPFPVLVFMHGRHSTCYQTNKPSNATDDWPCISGHQSITSYKGYDYLAQKMASHGYIVISISVNAINADDNNVADRGMSARAALMQHHLNLWNTWNTTGGGPFGSTFIGKLNLQNIGTMGHSRGGEGVIFHALLNKSLGSPYGIKAVITLAPVDFSRKILNNIPLMNIAPYCDGDVSDLQGVHYYDDVRYNNLNDDAPKHSVLMIGANHNFFNTVWTPGSYIAGTSDDWNSINGSGDIHCGTAGSKSKRLSAAKQQAAFATYASAFFRLYIGKETAFAPILEADDIIPPLSSGLDSSDIFVSYHAPASKRLDINRHLTESSELTNVLTGSVSSSGLLKYDVCADDAGELFCVSSNKTKEPHSGKGTKLGMPQLAMRWDGPTDYYQNNIPLANQNFSLYKNLQFRAAVNYSETAVGQLPNYSIQLIDASGAISTKQISDYTNSNYFPPGTKTGILPKVCFNSIKIPLIDFTGVNLNQIEKIKFLFNKTVAGSIFITDLMLSGLKSITTSLSNNDLKSEITIYPNPTNNISTINLGEDYKNITQLNLFDIQGKLMYQTNNITQELIDIDLSNFISGIYILNISSTNSNKNYKIVKLTNP